MPAASIAPIMLVEQAITVEKAGMVGSPPASSSTSRARLLQVRFGMTVPQTAKSGLAFASIALTTGTDRLIASWPARAPSTLANGVRTPAASHAPDDVVADEETATMAELRSEERTSPIWDRLPALVEFRRLSDFDLCTGAPSGLIGRHEHRT